MPPPNHHHSRTVQQKTFLKNLTQKKGDMIERQCPKERKKKPSSVRKLQKKQTTHIEANTPHTFFFLHCVLGPLCDCHAIQLYSTFAFLKKSLCFQ